MTARRSYGNITTRNLNDDVKARLQMRTAEKNRFMQDEARIILRESVSRKPSSQNLTEIFESHFGLVYGKYV